MAWFNKKGAVAPAAVSDGFKVQRGADLLRAHEPVIARIRNQVGIPQAHWAALYESMLVAYAEFVQAMPASEAHHHAGPGGMLVHGLEVLLSALRDRRGRLLPAGASSEELAAKADLWTYATATAALLHDIGKPVLDQAVTLYDKHGKPLAQWEPWLGSIPVTRPDAAWYSVSFVRGRKYAMHEQVAPLFARFIVPVRGLVWLAGDKAVLEPWIAAISGRWDDAGVLGEMVNAADGLSVAENLAGGQVQKMPGVRQRPLSERIAVALRYLVDQGALPLNKDGAAGWVQGDDLWLVAKRALDDIRNQLVSEGQTGIPSRNDRLMDELQQVGILIPCGERAVWKITVFHPTWPRAHTLSVLRVRLSRIWGAGEGGPEAFAGGTITPEAQGAEGDVVNQVEAPPTAAVTAMPEGALLDIPAPAAPAVPAEVPVLASDVIEADAEVTQGGALNTEPGAPAPLSFELEPLVPDDGGPALDGNTKAPSPVPPPHEPLPAAMAAPSAPTPKPAPQQVPSATTFPAPEATSPQPAPTADTEQQSLEQRFMTWLRDGLANGRMPINTVNARIHTVPEGVLLVSPGIFKDFDSRQWEQAQKRFSKLKVHRKNIDGTNIHTYTVSGGRKKSVVKGYLITEPDNVFFGMTLPAPNPHLAKEKEAAA